MSDARLSLSRLARALPDLLFALLVLAGVVWLMAMGSERLGYNWQWHQVPPYLLDLEDGLSPGPLLAALAETLRIAGVALLLSFFFGLAAAVLRLSPSLIGRAVARGYLELIRNTPLLIQIFFIYFVLGPMLDIPRFWAGVLALSLFEGAYASEIIRAGITSVARGQWEAAHSLGLSVRHTYRRIILPQALRRVIPPLTSQAVALVKDSALLSTISIFELTLRGQVIVADTFLTFEIWFTVAALYLLVTLSLSALSGALEHRFKVET
ncbi:amino acid ABC transporter permease [Desulfohalovibrio reitneri]|uniref:amino acid ABC transporter permease n=1 Tax=Desulfohalovibrio reitneri TaxID=1307759 RepID=UPI0004A77284|nr:amino acid ABC transporter permease [Desulfohalovibrio reitneri]